MAFNLINTAWAASDAITNAISGLGTAGGAAGFGARPSILFMIGTVIQVILGLVGLAFLVLLVYAGILYIMARGDEAQVKKAKALISDAVIGMIIIVASYAISTFVIEALILVVQTD